MRIITTLTAVVGACILFFSVRVGFSPLVNVVVGENTPTLIDAPQADTSGGKNVDVRSSFDIVAASAFRREAAPRRERSSEPRKTFDLASWTQQTQGGLKDADRRLLGELYGSAASVFEWGLGESTYIAAEVGVPRYGGIDSDARWVSAARDRSPDRFRFYLGDVGPTKEWGRPQRPRLPKAFVNYQIAPLLAEERPFELYMVDGRMRLPCALVAFLHASSRGATAAERSPKVLIHDYYHEVHSRGCADCRPFFWQKHYHRIEEVANLVSHSGGMLALFQRKVDASDEDILRLWNETAFMDS